MREVSRYSEQKARMMVATAATASMPRETISSIASDAAHEEDNCTLVNARNLSPFGQPKISSNANDMFKPPSVQGRVRRHYGFGLGLGLVQFHVHFN